MLNIKLAGIAFGGIAIVALSGCEQLEQTAAEAVDEARQTAVQALDEARQANTVEEAKQSAGNALDDVRQQAAGLLQQASDILVGNQAAQDDGQQELEATETPEAQTDS